MANSPDPLEHLSDYEKKLLIAMVPTYHERQRMRREGTNNKSREALIIEFLLQRRGVYEHCLKATCAASGVEPPKRRDLMSDERFSRYKSLISQAAAHASDMRVPDPDRDPTLRKFFQGTDTDDDYAPKRRHRR